MARLSPGKALSTKNAAQHAIRRNSRRKLGRRRQSAVMMKLQRVRFAGSGERTITLLMRHGVLHYTTIAVLIVDLSQANASRWRANDLQECVGGPSFRNGFRHRSRGAVGSFPGFRRVKLVRSSASPTRHGPLQPHHCSPLHGSFRCREALC